MPLNSGLKVDDEAVKSFGDMKLGAKSTRYITLKLNDDNTCVFVESKVQKDSKVTQKEDYDNLVGALSKSEGRFILLDLQVTKANGSTGDQLYCIMWNPDNAGAKSKMLYASALPCVLNTLKLESAAVTIQANDLDEMSYETLMIKGKK